MDEIETWFDHEKASELIRSIDACGKYVYELTGDMLKEEPEDEYLKNLNNAGAILVNFINNIYDFLDKPQIH